MRSLLWIPLTIVLLTAAAWGILRGMSGRVPIRELLAAAGITIVAAELSLTPMMLTRHARQGAVSQAGLVGTVLHLFLSITLAGAVYMMKLVPNRGMFLFLLVA